MCTLADCEGWKGEQDGGRRQLKKSMAKKLKFQSIYNI